MPGLVVEAASHHSNLQNPFTNCNSLYSHQHTFTLYTLSPCMAVLEMEHINKNCIYFNQSSWWPFSFFNFHLDITTDASPGKSFNNTMILFVALQNLVNICNLWHPKPSNIQHTSFSEYPATHSEYQPSLLDFDRQKVPSSFTWRRSNFAFHHRAHDPERSKNVNCFVFCLVWDLLRRNIHCFWGSFKL